MGDGFGEITRRQVLETGAAAGVLLGARPAGAAAAESPSAAAAGLAPVAVELNVNGELHHLALDPRTTLLDALREHLALTGTKKGCDHGQCGRLHGAARRAADQRVPVARGDA